VVEGVETSRDFHLRLLEHPDVQAGEMSIQWLESHLTELTSAPASDETIRLAAVAAALAAHEDRAQAPSAAGVAASQRATSAWQAIARRESLGLG
jgi:acetyl-CoA carboxylase, biotin carboxylase subunit